MLAQLLIFFLLTPFLRKRLGNEIMGIWFLINGLTGYLSIVHSSLNTGVVKYVAEYRARNDIPNLERIVGTSLTMYCLLGLAALVVGSGIYLLAGNLKAITQSANPSMALMVLAIMMLNFILNLPFVGVRAILMGLQRYEIINTANILSQILIAIGSITVVLAGKSLLAITLVYISICLVTNVILAGHMKYNLPCSISFGSLDATWMRNLFRFGFYSFINVIAAIFFLECDNIVIGAKLDANSILIYSLGFKLIFFTTLVTRSIMTTLMPVASSFSVLPENSKQERINELLVRGSRFGGLIAFAPLVFLIVFGQRFLSLWQGEEYYYSLQSYHVFLILVGPFMIHIALQIFGAVLWGVNKYKFITINYVFISLLNLFLSLYLVNIYGIYGVAIGTAIPLIIGLIINALYYRFCWKTFTNSYFKQVWLPLGILTALYAGMLVLESQFIPLTSLWAIVALAMANCIAFWLAGYSCLDNYEKYIIGQLWSKILRKKQNTHQ